MSLPEKKMISFFIQLLTFNFQHNILWIERSSRRGFRGRHQGIHVQRSVRERSHQHVKGAR